MEGAESQCGGDTKSHDSGPVAGIDIVLESQSEPEELDVTVSEREESTQTGRTEFATDSHTGQLSTADSRLRYVVSEPSDSEPSPACSQTGHAGSQTGQAGSQTGPTGSQTGQAGSQTGHTGSQTSHPGSVQRVDGEVWLKFNDVSVMEVGWEEVVSESFGGRQNTSAYCLIYISQAAGEQWAGHGELTGA